MGHGRIGCKHCDWKGYSKRAFWSGEKEEIIVTPCSSCKDRRGYNLYVKRKYGKETTLKILDEGEQLADVIDFQKYKDNKELRYYDKEESKELGDEQFRKFGEIPRTD